MTWQQQLAAVLLPAILQVESAGRIDVPDGKAGERGPYQMKRAAWSDAQDWLRSNGCEPLPPWETGARDMESARTAAEAYLLRWGEAYAARTGRAPTMEALARIYNGGPRGSTRAREPATREYWRKVQAEMERQEKEK